MPDVFWMFFPRLWRAEDRKIDESDPVVMLATLHYQISPGFRRATGLFSTTLCLPPDPALFHYDGGLFSPDIEDISIYAQKDLRFQSVVMLPTSSHSLLMGLFE